VYSFWFCTGQTILLPTNRPFNPVLAARLGGIHETSYHDHLEIAYVIIYCGGAAGAASRFAESRHQLPFMKLRHTYRCFSCPTKRTTGPAYEETDDEIY
jgi:hypothetical protein